MLDGEYVFPDPRRFSRFIDYSRRSIRDEHAALIVKQIKRSRPTMRIVAIGGEKMKERGSTPAFQSG